MEQSKPPHQRGVYCDRDISNRAPSTENIRPKAVCFCSVCDMPVKILSLELKRVDVESMCLLRLEFFWLGVQSHGDLDFHLGLRVPLFRRGPMRILACAACLFASLFCARGAIGQTAPSSPDHPWHTAAEQKIEAGAKGLRDSRFSVDPD